MPAAPPFSKPATNIPLALNVVVCWVPSHPIIAAKVPANKVLPHPTATETALLALTLELLQTIIPLVSPRVPILLFNIPLPSSILLLIPILLIPPATSRIVVEPVTANEPVIIAEPVNGKVGVDGANDADVANEANEADVAFNAVVANDADVAVFEFVANEELMALLAFNACEAEVAVKDAPALSANKACEALTAVVELPALPAVVANEELMALLAFNACEALVAFDAVPAKLPKKPLEAEIDVPAIGVVNVTLLPLSVIEEFTS